MSNLIKLNDKLPGKLSYIQNFVDLQKLADHFADISKIKTRHENIMKEREQVHRILVDEANGIAKYRKELMDDLTPQEKEMLTIAFIKRVVG